MWVPFFFFNISSALQFQVFHFISDIKTEHESGLLSPIRNIRLRWSFLPPFFWVGGAGQLKTTLFIFHIFWEKLRRTCQTGSVTFLCTFVLAHFELFDDLKRLTHYTTCFGASPIHTNLAHQMECFLNPLRLSRISVANLATIAALN